MKLNTLKKGINKLKNNKIKNFLIHHLIRECNSAQESWIAQKLFRKIKRMKAAA